MTCEYTLIKSHSLESFTIYHSLMITQGLCKIVYSHKILKCLQLSKVDKLKLKLRLDTRWDICVQIMTRSIFLKNSRIIAKRRELVIISPRFILCNIMLFLTGLIEQCWKRWVVCWANLINHMNTIVYMKNFNLHVQSISWPRLNLVTNGLFENFCLYWWYSRTPEKNRIKLVLLS